MKNCFGFLVIMISQFSFIYCADVQDPFSEDGIKELEKCLQEQNVDKTEDLPNLLESMDQSAHCAMGCYMIKIGLISSELTVNIEKALEITDKFVSDKEKLETVKKIVLGCVDTLKRTEMKTPCDVSMKHIACIMKNLP